MKTYTIQLIIDPATTPVPITINAAFCIPTGALMVFQDASKSVLCAYRIADIVSIVSGAAT